MNWRMNRSCLSVFVRCLSRTSKEWSKALWLYCSSFLHMFSHPLLSFQALHPSLLALLDSNPFSDINSEQCSMEDITRMYGALAEVTHAVMLHEGITRQLFTYLFFFTSTNVFNKLIVDGNFCILILIVLKKKYIKVLKWCFCNQTRESLFYPHTLRKNLMLNTKCNNKKRRLGKNT